MLPSLYALRVFEVVGRNMHFTNAARELGISQGAVSHQIKTLETQLGFPLFDREGRTVALTREGRLLLPAIQQQFGEMASVIEELRAVQGTLGRSVTILTTTYFASRWLSKRLSSFMSRQPDIALRIVHASANRGTGASHDFEIRWGNGTWHNTAANLLFEANLTPVCSRSLIGSVDLPFRPAYLKNYAFLHDGETQEAWKQWIFKAGLKDIQLPLGPAIADPNVRMQAAVDKQGFALADWLVEEELSSGKLIAPLETTLSGYGYYLIKGNSELSSAARLFSSWLHAAAKKSAGAF